MNELLITPTILDQYEWYKTAPETPSKEAGLTWKEAAYMQLTNALKRIYTTPALPVQKGIEFEKYIYQKAATYTRGHNLDGPETAIDKFCFEISKAFYQVKDKKIVNVDGLNVMLFCKYDVAFLDKIIDIKTCNKPVDKEKYLASKVQHIMYSYVANRPFEYAIFQFENMESRKIVDLFRIPFVGHRDALELEIKDRVRGFFDFLRENDELREAYLTNFNMYLNKDFIKECLKNG